MNKKLLTVALAGVLPLSACSTYNDPYYGQNADVRRGASTLR